MRTADEWVNTNSSNLYFSHSLITAKCGKKICAQDINIWVGYKALLSLTF